MENDSLIAELEEKIKIGQQQLDDKNKVIEHLKKEISQIYSKNAEVLEACNKLSQLLTTKRKIEIVKSYTLARYSPLDRAKIHDEFMAILVKWEFDKHSKMPIPELMCFIRNWFMEMPITPYEYDELEKEYPLQVEGLEKEYI